MKKINTILIFLITGLLILYHFKCNNTTTEIKDNSAYFETIKIYESELADLREKNDSLEISYQNNKNVKDSIVYDIRKRYITIYDTLTNDTIECLPKNYVDTIVLTYENLLNDADTLIKVKSLTIDNLTIQNTIKDTIIDKFQHNELVYKQEIKKQKRKKWLFGGVGVGIGYVLGKIF